jgi:flagella basal body P-ring formation protein FlgA
MTRWIIVAFVFVAASLPPTHALRAQSKESLSINLKSKALVIGPKIRLGEVGVIEGANRKIKAALDSLVLGQAAPPGESRELTLSYIKNKMRAAGLKKYIRFIKGPKIIRVTTAHTQIDKAILRDAVTEFIQKHLPSSVVRYTVDFRRVPEDVAVSTQPTAMKVQVLGDSDLRGFKTFWVDLYARGKRLSRVPVTAYVRTFEKVVVAEGRIAKGEALDEARLREEVVETTNLVSPPLRLGMSAGRRARVIISPGQVLTEAQWEVPPLVERGQIVKLLARRGRVQVATMAKAQQTGGKWQRIRVRNIDSGKLLLAKVVDAQTVLVEP